MKTRITPETANVGMELTNDHRSRLLELLKKAYEFEEQTRELSERFSWAEMDHYLAKQQTESIMNALINNNIDY
ncbi:MAG: hypothetical protein ACRDE7_00270 [Sphingobacterium sp.]